MKASLNELKKIIKKELHERVVTGRRLDRYATAFSREIIIALKDSDLKEYVSENKEATFSLTTELLNDLEWVRDVVVNVKIEQPIEGNVVHGSYDWILDDDEETRPQSDVYVNIEFSQLYTDQDFSVLIPKLKETLRHELEHSGQPTAMLKSTYEKIPDKEIWKNLEVAEDYYTSESEVKGHIAGIYKRAKTEKKPAEDVLDHILDEVYHTGLSYGYSPEEIIPIVRRARELWRYYLVWRYPAADIDVS